MTPRRSSAVPFAVALSALLPACNPYQNFDGEYYAGPIDPTNFQAPYVGVEPGTPDQSGGVITPNNAFVKGNQISYYLFPFSAAQMMNEDPLGIGGDNPPAPKGYVFDPSGTSAFPSPSKCKAPSNYLFDQRTEAYRKDEQGVVFSDVPSDAAYIPVVAEVPVTSNGEDCQSIKSSQKLLTTSSVTVTKSDTGAATPDGKYLAFAVVDPGADVQPDGPNGLGPQHWGWYNHYLLAFIDGGYIPTDNVPQSGMMAAYTKMRAQILLTPTTIPGMDAMGNPKAVAGALGGGFDILSFARSDLGYSPVCTVIAYTPDDPLHPKTDASKLSQTEVASEMPSATNPFVYCFQTE